ncbi:MAG: hypothetical protein ACKPKO_44540, partial [Candidatus Fonsibacter sp.]
WFYAEEMLGSLLLNYPLDPYCKAPVTDLDESSDFVMTNGVRSIRVGDRTSTLIALLSATTQWTPAGRNCALAFC